jgi:hypothetical protein
MERFVDLGVSFFDEDFTLDPFPYLEDLYPRDDILGFTSDGMNFLFRFEEARQVIYSPHCRRELIANAEIEEREQLYAERYPNRARHLRLAYPNMAQVGRPDFVIKRLLMGFLDATASVGDFSGAKPIFERLSDGGRIDDYVESVQTLPMRVMLDTCGLPFTEEDLLDLNHAGIEFIKAFDNYVDEAPLKAADDAVARIWRFLEARLEEAPADSRIRRFVDEGRSRGVDDEKLIVNIGGFLIIPLANTAGISSAYLLRNLIRHPEVRRRLARDPGIVRDDNVMTELLRRDNHVKALARQVHADFELRSFPMRKGESIYLFFPGVNLDPACWPRPLTIDLDRSFTSQNNVIFGGSTYMCIGRKLGLEFLKNMTAGFVAHLPDHARIAEDEVEADGSWVAERITRKMPIVLEA